MTLVGGSGTGVGGTGVLGGTAYTLPVAGATYQTTTGAATFSRAFTKSVQGASGPRMGLVARSATTGHPTEIGWPVIGDNLLVNSNFAIRSRPFVGSSATAFAKNVTAFDGWYGGSSGVTLTYAALSSYSRTVTVTAGQLCQGIWSPPPGTYLLSWTGSGTGAIVNGSPSAQVNTLGPSPQVLTITTTYSVLGVAMAGTFANVKLERISPSVIAGGDAPTPSDYIAPDLMLDAARVMAGAGTSGSSVGTLNPFVPRTVVSSATTGSVSDRVVAYTSTNGGTTYQLPPAVMYPIGQVLTVYDEAGAITPASPLVVSLSGSDTINGKATSYNIGQAYGYVALVSDGVSKWTIVDASPINRRAVADAAVTLSAVDRIVAYTSITASRVATLPAASAYPVGTTLTVVDESGSVTSAITISVTPAGSDTINGKTAAAVLNAAYGTITIESDGSSKWSIVAQSLPSGLATTNRTAVSDANYTPVATDRIVAYTKMTASRYFNLPTAASYPVGSTLTVVDESGSLTASIVITVIAKQSTSDTVEGVAYPNSIAINAPYGFMQLESDGVSKWTIIAQNLPAAVANISKTPTVTQYTSGSGTYTAPTGIVFAKVRMCGAGGGGGGASGSTAGSAGSTGNASTFGTWKASGGAGGGAGPTVQNTNAGSTVGTGTLILFIDGALGNSGTQSTSTVGATGGAGGGTPFGPGGPGGNSNPNTGGKPLAYGGGGGGGGINALAGGSGTGGNAGAYYEFYMSAAQLAGGIAYAVGGYNVGGNAGSAGNAGGNSLNGVIIIEEHYCG